MEYHFFLSNIHSPTINIHIPNVNIHIRTSFELIIMFNNQYFLPYPLHFIYFSMTKVICGSCTKKTLSCAKFSSKLEG